MNPYDDIDNFLEIRGCAALCETLRARDILEVFSKDEIESVLPDRTPFLLLKKAVHFRDQDENDCLVAMAMIDEDRCGGHIPEQLMAPAIVFSWGLALTGRLLSACVTEREKVVAEFVEAYSVRSLLSLADLHYAKPPIQVLFFARKIGQGPRTVTCDTHAWIVGLDSFVPAVSISKMQYAIIPKRVFLRALRGSEKKGEQK